MPALRRLTLVILTCFSALAAQAQTDAPRIVAVLISSDTGNDRAARFEAALQSINAETLLVEAASDAELRALLQRFTTVALDADVAIVYIDAPILMLGERGFVATPGLSLPRASSLLTRAVPLSAFARAANLAGSAGVVVVSSQAFEGTLPAGATQASRAPASRSGLAPILFMPDSEADRGIDAAATAMNASTVELGAVLDAMRATGDISISNDLRSRMVLQAPAPVARAQPQANTAIATTGSQPAAIAEPAQPEVANPEPPAAEAPVAEETANITRNTAGLPQVSAAETAAQQTAPPNATPRTISLEELQALENNLSRTSKRAIQSGLRERGFYRGLIDGLFGRQTRIAVEAFQESLGDEPTGVLTVEQAAMFE